MQNESVFMSESWLKKFQKLILEKLLSVLTSKQKHNCPGQENNINQLS